VKVERRKGSATIALDPREVALLRHTLERALFIDTPVQEQESIQTFATRLLDALSAPA
jgi:hypothetical protein